MITQRQASAEDREAVLALIPRLGEVYLPAHRQPEHAWYGVRDLFHEWLAGNKPDTRVQVAESDGRVVGITITTLRDEALSHVLSAHLYAIAIAKDMEGKGIATQLLAAAQQQAKQDGAKCMTLNVFTNNTRAQHLYNKHGFDNDMIRCYKPL